MIALILVFLVASGMTCEKEHHQGYDERIDIRADYGEPEDVYTYTSEDYWSEEWWYWSQGIEFDFTKRLRGETSGCTKIIYTDIMVESTFEFTPIPSKEEFKREKLRKNKDLAL